MSYTHNSSVVCASPPRDGKVPTWEPPLLLAISPVEGSSTTSIAPPVFRCWIGRKVSPNIVKNRFLRCFFFLLVAAWVKSRAERPSVSGVNRQLHVQIGCKLGIRNRKDELTKQAKRNELQINPKVIKGVNACRKRTRSS